MTSRRPPEPRDAHTRRIRRVTRGVAAAAVLGTAAFGGLAAAASRSEAAAEDPPAATHDRTRVDSVRGAIDSMLADVFGDEDAQAPSSSDRAPVAPSGGS